MNEKWGEHYAPPLFLFPKWVFCMAFVYVHGAEYDELSFARCTYKVDVIALL